MRDILKRTFQAPHNALIFLSCDYPIYLFWCIISNSFTRTSKQAPLQNIYPLVQSLFTSVTFHFPFFLHLQRNFLAIYQYFSRRVNDISVCLHDIVEIWIYFQHVAMKIKFECRSPPASSTSSSQSTIGSQSTPPYPSSLPIELSHRPRPPATLPPSSPQVYSQETLF